MNTLAFCLKTPSKLGHIMCYICFLYFMSSQGNNKTVLDIGVSFNIIKNIIYYQKEQLLNSQIS